MSSVSMDQVSDCPIRWNDMAEFLPKDGNNSDFCGEASKPLLCETC